ncbi:MAG: serine/threonine-protein kinase [Planctomycetota bacterium]
MALKELLPNVEDHASSSGSAGMIDRFLREAKITGQLEHPNIVPVYEIGQREDGRTYYTMKFVKGKTLESRLRAINGDESIDDREKLSRRLRLLEQFLNVCHAIAYAHSRRVIHRDLKPANIMLGDFGETLVLDWGLARVLDQPLDDLQKQEKSSDLSASLLPEDSGSKTLDGAVLGTPAYMLPEMTVTALGMAGEALTDERLLVEVGRAKSYRKLDKLDAAAEDMYDFLDEFPNHERTVEAEALLAEIEKELDE